MQRIMVEREFGAAGDRLLVENLEGVEASYIVFTDGQHVLPAVAARDHKAAFDHDHGPNTGGMGGLFSRQHPGPYARTRILETIIRPVVDGMREEGTPFQGILYAGLMLTKRGPKVLEFNVRMGDPEGQVILPRLTSDFAELCETLCAARLKDYRAVGARVLRCASSLPPAAIREPMRRARSFPASNRLRRIAVWRFSIPGRVDPVFIGHRRRPGPGCDGLRRGSGLGRHVGL